MQKLIYFYCFVIVLAIVVGVYFISAFSQGLGYPPIKSDGEGYYAYLPTLLIHKTIDFRVLEQTHFQGRTYDWAGISLNASTGMLMNRYPIGVAVLMSPFFLVAHLSTKITKFFSADGYSLIYQCSVLVSALFYYLIGTYFLFKSLLKHFSERITLVTILFITFGTSLFHYITFDAVFSHVYSFCFVSILIYLTEQFWTRPSYLSAILLGASIGFLFLIRNYNLIYAIYFFLHPFNKSRYINIFLKKYSLVMGKFITVLLVAFIIVSPQLFIWKITTGKFIAYSYGDYGFNWSDPQILKVLFSLDNGLFIYSPTLIFAVLGLLIGFKQTHDKKMNNIALISLLIISLLIYIISSWQVWNFGASYGHRGFVDAYPFFAFGLAIAIRACYTSWSRVLIYTVLITSTIVVSIHMYNYWLGKIPFETPTAYIQALKSFPKRGYVGLFVPDYKKSTNINSGLKALVSDVSDKKIPNAAKPSQSIDVKYSILNTGESYWLDAHTLLVGGKVSLGVLWFPQLEKGKGCRRQLEAIDGTRIPLAGIVAPGERVYLHGSIQVPKVPGQYTMLIEMVSEGVAWFKDVSNSSVACYDIAVKK